MERTTIGESPLRRGVEIFYLVRTILQKSIEFMELMYIIYDVAVSLIFSFALREMTISFTFPSYFLLFFKINVNSL